MSVRFKSVEEYVQALAAQLEKLGVKHGKRK